MAREIKNTRVVIIGAGNVATHIAKSLCDKLNIVQIFSHSIENAKILADKIGCNSAVSATDDIVNDADCYIISIKDDVIKPLVQSIMHENSNALWVHTSGSKPIDVFRGSMCNYGVLYPLQTFSKDVDVTMSEVPFFVEASSENALNDIKELAYLLSPKVYDADSQVRRQLHIAAVFACNFTNHLWALSSDVLKESNLPFDVLMPLIKETVAKLDKVAPAQGQTGPAARGDREIIAKHLELLDGNKNEIYKIISESIIKYHQ